MQTNQPVSLFAAYPLKAIPEQTSSKRKPDLTPYLQALLQGQTQSASKARVFPMVDPYPAGAKLSTEPRPRHPFLKG